MLTRFQWLVVRVLRRRARQPARISRRPLVLAGLLLALAGATALICATPPPASSAQPAPGATPALAKQQVAPAAPAGTTAARGRPALPGGRPFGLGISPQRPGAGHPQAQATGVQRRSLGAPAHPADILYDQYDQMGGTATASQVFEPSWAAYTAQGADDFVIPAGLTWAVDQVEVAGVYSGGGVADSVNVIVYDDANSLPGAPVFTRTVSAYTAGPNPGDFVIPLNPPAVLPAGTYWLSVQANEHYNPDGQWFWADRAAQSNQMGVWRNPGGGFGQGCYFWAPRSFCFYLPSPRPDEVFRLRGSSNATPTPTMTGTPPTALPTDTATPTGIPATSTPSRTPAPTLTGGLPTPVATQPAPIPPSITPTPIPTCGLFWRPVPGPQPTPADDSLSAVAVVGPTDIWAVGSTGFGNQTLTGHWNGTSWTVVPSIDPGTFYDTFSGVAALGSSDVWAVGSYSNNGSYEQTLVEHWDGTAWTLIPSPNPSTGISYFSAVAAVAPDDLWAVGAYSADGATYQTLIEHWDGTVWTIVSSLSPGAYYNYLNAVVAVAPDDIWTVGLADGQTLVEHWDGGAWAIVPSPNPAPSFNELYGVAAVAADDIWAVGAYSTDGVTAQSLVEHWDGGAWTVIPSPNPGTYTTFLFSAAALAADDVWAVGYGSNDGSSSETVTEHWDGTTWAVVPSPSPGAYSNYLFGVAAVGTANIWTVGSFDDQTLTEHYSDPCVTPTPTGSPTPTVTGTPPTATATRTRTPTRTPTPTPCGTGNNYTYTTTTGTVVPGTIDIGNHCDDCATLISLPFAYQLYDQFFTSARAGSNGELAFGVDAPGYNEITCLPNNIATYTIAPLWVDQDLSNCADCGIFTSITGAAPNRIFNVEWRNLYFSEGGTHTLDYEVRLYEGQARFDLVYGAAPSHPGGTDSPLTVGVQKDTTLFTEVGCDITGTDPPVTSGQVLTFILPCGTPTPTSVPTHTPTSTPTGSATRTPTSVPTTTATTPPTGVPTATVTVQPTTVPTSAATTQPTSPPTHTRTPVVPTATPCAIRFSDVNSTDYFYEPVTYLYCHGIISGYADGTFRPYANTTRAQMVKIVVLGFGIPIQTPATPTFSDVPASNPFYAVIETAAAHNIVSGYADGTFRPNANVTRGQLAKIDVTATAWPLLNPAQPTFTDVPRGSAFYQFAETAVCHGIISGYADGTFRPGASATRGQISKIVYLSITNPAGACAPARPRTR